MCRRESEKVRYSLHLDLRRGKKEGVGLAGLDGEGMVYVCFGSESDLQASLGEG